MTPQHYTIAEGQLYGGEYPGSRMIDEAEARLRILITMGVRTFIDLTTPADRMEPYEGLLLGLENAAGVPLRRISLPIPDMRIPDAVDTMHEIMSAIRKSIEQAPAVYVHCWGGIGRTGMVVGCWLRELGYDPDAALKHVQHLYSSQMPKVRMHPESPQTNEQRDYVRRWEVQS
jgi:hypothetical protein